MRKPKIGDEWQLNWFKHKPVKRIRSFSPIWYSSRGCAVPAVWFHHEPKGKTITCSVRYLLENGVLVKPANTGSQPTYSRARGVLKDMGINPVEDVRKLRGG